MSKFIITKAKIIHLIDRQRLCFKRFQQSEIRFVYVTIHLYFNIQCFTSWSAWTNLLIYSSAPCPTLTPHLRCEWVVKTYIHHKRKFQYENFQLSLQHRHFFNKLVKLLNLKCWSDSPLLLLCHWAYRNWF